MPPAVYIEGLQVRADGRVLLQLPQLTLQAGEQVAVVGPNGAGKSTLLRCLGGQQPPDAGQVQVLGRDLSAPIAAAQLRRWRSEVGQLRQGLHLVPRLTALENVLIGALARVPGWRSWLRQYPEGLQQEAAAALDAVGLGAQTQQRVDSLSGGEGQRVALARLRLQHARLVLADEPTSQLDPSASRQACTWLTQAAAGATLITVVHDTALLPLLAQRVLGLRGGELAFDLPMHALTEDHLRRLYAPPRPAQGVDAASLEHTLPAFQTR